MKEKSLGIAAIAASSSDTSINMSTNTYSITNIRDQADLALGNNLMAASSNKSNTKDVHAVSHPKTDSTVNFANSTPDACADAPPSIVVQPYKRSLYFEVFPLEVRNMIYKLLLVNPLLGKVGSVADNVYPDHRPMSVKYELEPQILRVCHAMYAEASEILYGSNTFYIACCRSTNDLGPRDVGLEFPRALELTPILRYYTNADDDQLFIFDQPAMAKVRHWRVIVSSLTEMKMGRPATKRWSMGKFCQAIAQSPLISLEIALAPTNLEEPYDSIFNAQRINYYQDIKDLLPPLRMLRGVKKLQFRDADYAEMPWVHPYSPSLKKQPCRSILPDSNLEEELRSIMMGDSPVELSYGMYLRLTAYAQAFESVESFKFQMCYSSSSNVDQYIVRERIRPGSNNEMIQSPYLDRFNRFPAHPVEKGLESSRKFAEEYSPSSFRLERANIIQYLEPQYKRVMLAASNIVHFVKSEKREEGMLSANRRRGWYDPQVVAEAILLLEKYEEALQRDLPYHLQIQKRATFRQNAPRYNILPRKILMRQATDAYDAQSYQMFADAFRKAVDHMDKQYLEIRAARKALFESDAIPDTGCDLDLGLYLVDEKVDWDVDEPNFGPRYR